MTTMACSSAVSPPASNNTTAATADTMPQNAVSSRGGLADPRALTQALDAVATYERLGSPEGELALAQCVIYLACAAKSNSVYTAYGAAREFIGDDGSRPVPLRLRNAPTRLMVQ